MTKKRTFRLQVNRNDANAFLAPVVCSAERFVVEFQCDAGTVPIVKPLMEMDA